MKIDRRSTACSGGWLLSFGTFAIAAILFGPLPSSIAPESTVPWFSIDKVGAILSLGLAAAGFWAFRKRFGSRSSQESCKMRNGLALLLLQALLLRCAVELGHNARVRGWNWWPIEPWLWTPWFLTTGLAVMLLGSRLGFFLGLSGALLLYVRADPGPLPLIGCLVSSVVGIVLLRRSARRLVFQASAGSGLLLAVIGLIEGLQRSNTVESVAISSAVPLVMSLLSGLAVLALLPLMEWILGELSDATLAEYSDHPLLDQLKEQAPGTWHHTLNVADLAEKGAMAISARPLFCKTAALYHDIGKLKDPGLFAENISGPSPHDELDPRISAARIIEHVTYGLDLARKHRLPKAFRVVIAEHHGLSTLRYFYAKACQQLRPDESPEGIRPLFTYPGPCPSSRESGIISLADIIEAATRSTSPKTDEEALAIVRKLVADRIAEGELAHCPLTLIELSQVEATFVAWLKARAHTRPAYPQASPILDEASSKWAKSETAAQPAWSS